MTVNSADVTLGFFGNNKNDIDCSVIREFETEIKAGVASYVNDIDTHPFLHINNCRDSQEKTDGAVVEIIIVTDSAEQANSIVALFNRISEIGSAGLTVRINTELLATGFTVRKLVFLDADPLTVLPEEPSSDSWAEENPGGVVGIVLAGAVGLLAAVYVSRRRSDEQPGANKLTRVGVGASTWNPESKDAQSAEETSFSLFGRKDKHAVARDQEEGHIELANVSPAAKEFEDLS